MGKPRILQDYINGVITNAKMCEIIALCSLYLNELTESECWAITDRFPYVFSVGMNNDGKRVLNVSSFNKPLEKAEQDFYSLVSLNKIKIDKSKIMFVK